MTDRDDELRRSLDALLGDEPPVDAGEVARLRLDLDAAATALRARAFTHPRDEARFVARVLARTTREDLSLAGDFRLCVDFLRARLRASRALRLVAASLALHLVAGPAVAWWMLREPEPERKLLIRVEPAQELPFEEVSAPSEAPDDELLATARAREARENARATAHFLLQQRGRNLPELLLPGGASVALEQLGQRIAELRGEHREVAPPPQADDTLAATLWLERELDRLCASRASASAASTAARRLAAELAERHAGIDVPELAALVASTLQRAWAEGLIETAPSGAPGPFSPDWFDALAGASAALPEDESGLVRRWVAAARVK